MSDASFSGTHEYWEDVETGERVVFKVDWQPITPAGVERFRRLPECRVFKNTHTVLNPQWAFRVHQAIRDFTHVEIWQLINRLAYPRNTSGDDPMLDSIVEDVLYELYEDPEKAENYAALVALSKGGPES